MEGLPRDATEEELFEAFKKCGVVKLDARTERPKVKVYRDERGEVKGDGLVVFFETAERGVGRDAVGSDGVEAGRRVDEDDGVGGEIRGDVAAARAAMRARTVATPRAARRKR